MDQVDSNWKKRLVGLGLEGKSYEYLVTKNSSVAFKILTACITIPVKIQRA